MTELSTAPDNPSALPVRYAAKLVEPANGTYLFVPGKRALDNGGLLNLIGGGIRDDESPAQALMREAMEEAGLELCPKGLFEMGGVEGNVNNCRGEQLLARWILFGYRGELDARGVGHRFSPDALGQARAHHVLPFSELALKAVAFSEAARSI